jgi:hypothetical protein
VSISKDEVILKGKEILEGVKRLAKEGNLRKIVVKDKNGKVVATFPLYAGAAGAIFAPALAAIGALIAITNDCTVSVIKKRGQGRQ